MRGYLIDKNGSEYELENLLTWDVCHGMGEPCDYFEVNALYTAAMLPKLASATRFKGIYDGKTVFFGVVDEYKVSIDEKGATVAINGRSLAALLMDNEVEERRSYIMTRSTIIDTCLMPFGITDIKPATMQQVVYFPIKRGDSAWTALKRFCLKSAHAMPRFTPAGKLLMTEEAGSTLQINADAEAERIKYKDERYGVISKITVANRAGGGSYTLTNQAFVNRGGSCRRYLFTEKFDTVITDPSQAGDRFTGEYQIAQSMSGKNCIEITVPRQFACFPGDTVSFSSRVLGLSGSYKVTATHCWADAVSAGTLITMEV